MEAPNPIGIAISNADLSHTDKVAIGSTLGAHYFLLAPIDAAAWKHSSLLRTDYQNYCATITNAGMQPVIAITPTVDHVDCAPTYTDIVVTCAPSLVVLRTPETETRDHLNTLARICHSNRARSTHAPIDSSDIAIMLASDDQTFADILDPTERRIMSSAFTEKRTAIAERTASYLDMVQQSDVDFVNIGWNSQTDEHFERIVREIAARTGKPVVSTALARPIDEYCAERLMKSALKAGLPYAIWYFSVEGPRAYSLKRPDGTLGKSASLFTHFMRRHFTH